MLEAVVLGGVAFYLDHENQMVIPMEPAQLPPEAQSLSKTPSRRSISKSPSKITSYSVTP